MTDDTLPAPEHQPQRLRQTHASWRAMFWRGSNAVLSDELNGHNTGGRDVNSVIAAVNLPVELASLIQAVVRATRLWPSERVDVARELASHCREGLDGGTTAADLMAQFGDPILVARLIRKSRIRCRSALWHTWYYSKLGMALLIVLYVGLAMRFYLSRPTINRNFVREINDQIKTIPEEQQAWPLYRAAIELKKPYPKPDGNQPTEFKENWWLMDANRVDHNSLAWNQLLIFVNENETSIQKLHEAAGRPASGIIYGEREDAPGRPASENMPMFETSLNQVQEMRTFAGLLCADALVATSLRDGVRLTRDLQSLIAMAEHCRGNWLVEELTATTIMQITMLAIRDSLEDTPDLMTGDQLAEVAQPLAAHHGGGTIRFEYRFDQLSIEDILQRSYTDDGHGNGSLTPEGLKLFAGLTSGKWGGSDEPLLASTVKNILAPAFMLRAMSRRESQELQVRLFSEWQTIRRGPLYTWGESDPVEELLQKERPQYFGNGGCAGGRCGIGNGTMTLIPALSIPLLLFPNIKECDRAAERFCQVRDGTLTAIALELYRRRHGAWPEALDQLVPHYLPELPIDRFTGYPLRYCIRDGRPLVYACGMDQQDDGGRDPTFYEPAHLIFQKIFAKPATQPEAGTGYDWVLFPRPRQPSSN